jgi:hypothetical protein
VRLLGDILRDMGLVPTATPEPDVLARQAQDIATRWPYPADDIRHGLALGLTVDEVEACLKQAAQAMRCGVSMRDLMSMVAREKERA